MRIFAKRPESEFFWRESSKAEPVSIEHTVTLHSSSLRTYGSGQPSLNGRLCARLGCQRLLYITPQMVGFDAMRECAETFGADLRVWKMDGELDVNRFEKAVEPVDRVLFPLSMVPPGSRLPIRRCCRELNTPLIPIRNPSRTCFRNALMAVGVVGLRNVKPAMHN